MIALCCFGRSFALGFGTPTRQPPMLVPKVNHYDDVGGTPQFVEDVYRKRRLQRSVLQFVDQCADIIVAQFFAQAQQPRTVGTP